MEDKVNLCGHRKILNSKTYLAEVEVAAQQNSRWPKQMEVISNVLFKICHKEMSGEVVHQVILIKIAVHHGKKPSIRLISLIRKKTYKTRKVHPAVESHQYKNLEIKLYQHLFLKISFTPYLVEHFGTDFEGSVP